MTHTQKKAGLGLAAFSMIAFVALGMPDGLLGVAWPSMRRSFGQELDALAVLLAGGTTGYLVSSFLNGWLMTRLGVGKLLGISSLLTALALLGYTISPWWPLMFFLAMLSGLGAGAIDAGLNAWVESHLDHKIMQWLHGSFGIGITLGPLIMTLGLAQTGSWHPGYLVVAVIQATLGLLFLLKAGMWDNAPKAEHWHAETDTNLAPLPFSKTLQNPRSWLSSFLFFVYVGIELGMGHWAFTWLVSVLGLSPDQAGLWTGAYWAAFTLGRFAGGFLSRHFKPLTMVWMSLALAALVTLTLASGIAGTWQIALLPALGLVIAPIFPSLVSSTSQRVGRQHAASTIGMQMSMAGLGVGVIPGLMGTLAKNFGLNIIPLLVFILSLVLLVLLALFRILPQASKEVAP